MYSQSYREKLRHLQSVSHHFKQFIFSKKEKRCRMQSVKFKSYSVCAVLWRTFFSTLTFKEISIL